MSMKFAILSDVHGNAPALRMVLEDAAKRGIDRLIVAGDYCLSGAWTDGQMQISYWYYRNIRKENLDFVLSLPHTAEFEADGVKIPAVCK